MRGTSGLRCSPLHPSAWMLALLVSGVVLLGLPAPIAAQSKTGGHSGPGRVADSRQAPVGWRRWELGDVSIAAPDAWAPVSGATLPLDATVATWGGAAFAERPAAVETGALLVLAWGIGEGGYGLGLDASDIVGGSAISVAGRTAGRVDFQVRDKRNDTRGFDVVIGPEGADSASPPSSPSLTVTCRGPNRDWRRIEPLCIKVVSTLTLRLAASTGTASAANSSPSSPSQAAAATGATKESGTAHGVMPRPAAKPVMASPPSGRRTLVPAAPAWRATSWGRGRPEFVTVSATGTNARFPADVGGGGAGITSTQTAVRLGDLAGGASTTLTFRFDASATDGWRISLCPARLDSCWSERGYTLFWQPAATPGQWQLLRKSNDGKHRELATVQRVSSELKLRLSASGVEVSSEDIAPTQDSWELLTSFLGFELAVEGVPPREGAGQSFALKAIDIDEQYPEAASPSRPAVGVEPLPSRRLFAGAPGPEWSVFARSGGDAAFIGADDVVRVPEKRGWGWTGLALRQRAIEIPTNSALAPRRLRIATDPTTTTGFAVMLSAEPEPGDPWLQSKVWVQWARSSDGSGKLTLVNCASANREVSMAVPAGWDGNLDIRLQDGLVEIGLDGRWRIAGASTCVAKGNRFWLSIFAAPDKENRAAVLSLKRVDVDRVTPAGMTLAKRFALLDDEDFDPIEFLDALALEGKGRTP